MVCPYSLAVWGGVQAQVLGLSRALRENGVDVQVLGPCDGQPPEPWVTPLGNSIPYAMNGSMAPLAPDPAAQLRMLGAMKDHRFDLLHLHEPLAPGPTLTSLVVKSVPIVGTFHVSGNVPAYKWAKPIVKKLASRVDVKVAVSSEAAGMAGRYLGGEYEILYNGVEIKKFDIDRRIETKLPSVLFLGRHEPRKGLKVLLESLQHLPQDIEIWIAGTGPETEQLKAYYSQEDRLVWLGQISESEKILRLKSADLFCIPSLGGESFGIVLLEAMAAKVPIVASDLKAYKAVARESEEAEFFETGNPRSLAKSILNVLSNSPTSLERAEKAYKSAKKHSMGNLAESYLTIYNRLLNKEEF